MKFRFLLIFPLLKIRLKEEPFLQIQQLDAKQDLVFPRIALRELLETELPGWGIPESGFISRPETRTESKFQPIWSHAAPTPMDLYPWITLGLPPCLLKTAGRWRPACCSSRAWIIGTGSILFKLLGRDRARAGNEPGAQSSAQMKPQQLARQGGAQG